LLPLTILFCLVDFLRHHISLIEKVYLFLFDRVTRDVEKQKNVLTGASYYLIGCLLTVYFINDESIIMASLLVMSISDSFAAIIGIKYGKTKIYKNKSLEGSFAFLGATLIILSFFVPGLSIPGLIFISITLTFVELLSFHLLNDNLTIPISSAIMIQYLV
tara:strand:- start:1180 stop:1662 length:483 start_codon:yes stop_codon:yes gene_type:complete